MIEHSTAIYHLYPNVVSIDEDLGPLDGNGEAVSIDLTTVKQKAVEIKAQETMDALRFRRNALLTETDWWVLPGQNPTQVQLDYRQALRDLPANTVEPENPVWPVKPQ